MKIYVVISANEYSNSTSDIKVRGVFKTYKEADNESKKVQAKLDNSTSLGWQVWIEESILVD